MFLCVPVCDSVRVCVWVCVCVRVCVCVCGRIVRCCQLLTVAKLSAHLSVCLSVWWPLPPYTLLFLFLSSTSHRQTLSLARSLLSLASFNPPPSPLLLHLPLIIIVIVHLISEALHLSSQSAVLSQNMKVELKL